MSLPPLTTKLLNVTIYQVGWFCCVLGAAWGFPIAGALCALLLAGLHLLLAVCRKNEALLMLAACLLGILIDSLQQALGLFSFTRDPVWPFWLPLWVVVIWAQFATLLRYALHWLTGRYGLAAVLGGLGGPLAYWGGIRLGAASFGDKPILTIMTLSLVWALVTPLLCRLSDLIDKSEGRYRLPGSR